MTTRYRTKIEKMLHDRSIQSHVNVRIRDALYTPSKREQMAMLAEAARNTAALPQPEDHDV